MTVGFISPAIKKLLPCQSSKTLIKEVYESKELFLQVTELCFVASALFIPSLIAPESMTAIFIMDACEELVTEQKLNAGRELSEEKINSILLKVLRETGEELSKTAPKAKDEDGEEVSILTACVSRLTLLAIYGADKEENSLQAEDIELLTELENKPENENDSDVFERVARLRKYDGKDLQGYFRKEKGKAYFNFALDLRVLIETEQSTGKLLKSIKGFKEHITTDNLKALRLIRQTCDLLGRKNLCKPVSLTQEAA